MLNELEVSYFLLFIRFVLFFLFFLFTKIILCVCKHFIETFFFIKQKKKPKKGVMPIIVSTDLHVEFEIKKKE